MINEKQLTKAELDKREDIIMKMKKNKRALVQKYGKDAEAVMYGRATNIAKKQAESMDNDKLREMVKAALKNPKKADLNKDGKLSSYEKTRGAAIEKAMVKEWGGSDQFALIKSMHRDLGEPTEFPGLTRVMAAAEDATDFYMDDFENFDNEREGLIMSNARSYALRMFPDFMSMAAKMVEPSNINRFNETSLEEGASSEEKRIAMRAIKSIAKYRGVENDEAKADLLRAIKELGNVTEGQLTESKEAGLNELRGILDQAGSLGEEARNIIESYFPRYLRQAEAYGAFSFVESSNPYDTTLASIVDEIENDEDSYEEEDLEEVAGLNINTTDDVEGGEEISDPDANVAATLGAEDVLGLEEGHSLSQEDLDILKDLESKTKNSSPAKKVLKSLIKSNIKQGDLGTKEVKEDIDLGHEDNEPGMIKAELYQIGSCSMDLYKIMDNLESMGEEIDLPSWWQSKITTAENNITSAKEYLEFELKEPAIDSMVSALSENEDSTDEAEKLIIKTLEDEGGAAGLDPLVKAVKKLNMSKDDVVSLLKKMAKVKLHKNGDYILFPVNEGLPKGYWDKKMVAKDEVDESYKTLVNKIKKQGKSEKAAKAIAGAVASYKAKGGGKGPTAKQKG